MRIPIFCAAAAAVVIALAGCSAEELVEPPPLPETAPAPHAADRRFDVDYAPESAAQRLDLYVPAGTAPSPVVVYVHGGDWRGGDKGEVAGNGLDDLLEAGFAVASINYRLTDEARWPAAVQDAKAAVGWLRTNARQHHLDPERIAVVGSSSGGYLAAAVALTGDRPSEFDPPQPTPGAPVSTAVQAAVLWSAPVDFRSLDRQLEEAGCPPAVPPHGHPASAASQWLGEQVGAGPRTLRADLLAHVLQRPTASFLFVHGTDDCVVPPAQARSLHREIRRAGGTSTLALIEGMGHRGGTGRRVRETVAFLNETVGRPAPAPHTTG
ncbi:alpha/beta hydrolase [Thermomonospora cellulosilytica]|uniref:Acetyl esterase/lipase n=1 Tax=Thermomonospora cellulosilytica TaxID=1411118 RepID=A0A7W3N5E3_9ACTN|nr:alpha/beta hydrolase [Thermomonospora cellulosilytica]MBA9007840.1 acetyl esterase/lipase [Thermomonospora cellulosilytica]